MRLSRRPPRWSDSSSKQSRAPRSAAVLTGTRSTATGHAAADLGPVTAAGLARDGMGQAAGVMVTVRPSAWSWRMWLRIFLSLSVRLA